LTEPPQASERDPGSITAGVTLKGDAKFLVGEVDLGREVGMEVLVRGLDVVVDAASREYRERHPRIEPDADDGDDSGPDEAVFDEPDLLGLSHEVTVPVEEAGDRLDDLLDEIDRGAHVVLVQDGKRVAVMMSWPAYADLREKLAGMAAAFWTAWRSGVFDVAGYATDVTRILHRRGTKPDPASDDEGSTSEDGDGDERAR
jgi:antitoxin (DNA-binding transcriptional repressor) of toxin-antitoxin stability system